MTVISCLNYEQIWTLADQMVRDLHRSDVCYFTYSQVIIQPIREDLIGGFLANRYATGFLIGWCSYKCSFGLIP